MGVFIGGKTLFSTFYVYRFYFNNTLFLTLFYILHCDLLHSKYKKGSDSIRIRKGFGYVLNEYSIKENV